MPAGDGPMSYRDTDAVRADVAALRAALDGVDVGDAFLSAASPGVVAFFLADRHYGDHEAYLFAIADAMKVEYDEIHRGGLVLQLDCPDLAVTRHRVGAESLEDYRRFVRLHVEAINHATRDIPPEAMRLHVCWGNYEGPHHHDVPLADIVVARGAAGGALVRGGQPAPRARVDRLRGRGAARGQAADPRRARHDDELHRAPRARGPADRPVRAARRARET
jgi:5-methyltetrahydropteroyltriglutamate--homocysteine methyltransferase